MVLAHIFGYLINTIYQTYFMKYMLSKICMQQETIQKNTCMIDEYIGNLHIKLKQETYIKYQESVEL